MASSLKDDLSCPVCRRLYRSPLLLSCGHSFCRRCLDSNCTVRSTYLCLVCSHSTGQRPVANHALRKACESYLKEKEENEGEARCSQHGEEMSFYCETDEEVICLDCKRHGHDSHRVQPLAQVVRQRKIQVKAALRPAEQALESLRHGTTGHARVSRYIQYQARQTERLIRKDFEKLQQFLKEEEEKRIVALKEEEERKTENMEERIEQQIVSLSNRVRDVEDKLENDDITFLQNFNYVLQRSRYEVPDLNLDSEALIDVARHLGNLKYRVWEKMKDLCPRYPVVLDPNTAPAIFSISDDLVSVEQSTNKSPSLVPHNRNRIVLGSEGYTDEFHCWDVEVGDSRHWTIGVCKGGTAERRALKGLTPSNGFWGLTREWDACRVLGSTSSWHWWNKMPRCTVRVKLGYHLMWRTVSFYDPSDGSMIDSIEVPTDEKLYPFLIPGENNSVLRIYKDHVALTVKQKFNLAEWVIDVDQKMIPIYVCAVCAVVMFIGFLVLAAAAIVSK